MLNTGHIVFMTPTSASGFDGNGNPIPVTYDYTDKIPCNIRVIDREYKVYAEGQYVQAQYSVTVQQVFVPETAFEKVQLYECGGVLIGTFQIHNKECLGFVRTMKLIL